MLGPVTHHNSVVIASAIIWSGPRSNRPNEDIITQAYRGTPAAATTSDGSWDVDGGGHANGRVYYFILLITCTFQKYERGGGKIMSQNGLFFECENLSLRGESGVPRFFVPQQNRSPLTSFWASLTLGTYY
jgi:hypothetical protein